MNDLCLIFGGFIFLVCIFAVLKYIFLEEGFLNNSSWVYYIEAYFIIMFLEKVIKIFNTNMYLITVFIFFVVFFLITRNDKFMGGLFLVIPSIGIALSAFMIPISIAYLSVKSMKTLSNTGNNKMWIFDVMLLLLLCLIVDSKQKWGKYALIVNNRKYLEKWEKYTLSAFGIFLVFIDYFVLSIDKLGINRSYAWIFIVVCNCIIILLEFAIITFVFQGSSAKYYEKIAEINEYYFKAQLKHFKAYEETQKETRRIRHDMNNHMNCIYLLLEEKRYDEIKEYINEMGNIIRNINKDIRTGNDIADAIINEKNIIARKNNINIELAGQFDQSMKADPIDICTIFSNALDNSIEALDKINNNNKTIYIKLKSKGNMHFISFLNLTEIEGVCEKTSKKDTLNHGFGLTNIRKAVKKYDGQINISIYKEDNKSYFKLDIIIFCN